MHSNSPNSVGIGACAKPADELLVLAPVTDEVGDRDEQQAVLVGEALELGRAGHVHLLLVDDLAQHARRIQAGEAGEVDGGLGVTGALRARRPRVLRAGGCGRGGRDPPDGSPGSTSALIVAARSKAEMPVLVPWRKSTDTRNAVRWLSVFCMTIASRSSSRARSLVIGAQM